jgi:transcriptional regulator with GAF, ATPase, and Fis domain
MQSATEAEAGRAGTRAVTLEEAERLHILKVLEETGWRVSGKSGAAERLGLKPTTLESRMKRLAINRKTS